MCSARFEVFLTHNSDSAMGRHPILRGNNAIGTLGGCGSLGALWASIKFLWWVPHMTAPDTYNAPKRGPTFHLHVKWPLYSYFFFPSLSFFQLFSTIFVCSASVLSGVAITSRLLNFIQSLYVHDSFYSFYNLLLEPFQGPFCPMNRFELENRRESLYMSKHSIPCPLPMSLETKLLDFGKSP